MSSFAEKINMIFDICVQQPKIHKYKNKVAEIVNTSKVKKIPIKIILYPILVTTLI